MLAYMAVAIGLAPASVVAQSDRARDTGAALCDRWTADRRTPETGPAVADEQWILGFLSGIGYMGLGELKPLNGISDKGVWAWVDVYCGNHPTAPIEQAAAAFSVAHPR
jgi:hypothetical protein